MPRLFVSDAGASRLVDAHPYPLACPGAQGMIDAWPLGKMRGQHAPLDPTFGAIKHGIEHRPHTEGTRASPAFGGGDQLFAPLPLLVGQVAWICLFIHISILHNPRRLFRQALILQLYLWNCTSPVVPIFGHPLVPAAPRRPRQNALHFLLRGQHEAPKEAPNLTYTQRYTSPRAALKAVRLLAVGWASVLLGASSVGRWVARSTVNNAYAHMANVICRYHPVHLRTS
jgi:hypothetical protein